MKTYLKFLSRNKLYTAIEFVGLSIALAFVIISFCYVVQQYAVTRENPDRERIYALGGENMINSYGMKDILDGKLPEVESVTCTESLVEVRQRAKVICPTPPSKVGVWT